MGASSAGVDLDLATLWATDVLALKRRGVAAPGSAPSQPRASLRRISNAPHVGRPVVGGSGGGRLAAPRSPFDGAGAIREEEESEPGSLLIGSRPSVLLCVSGWRGLMPTQSRAVLGALM